MLVFQKQSTKYNLTMSLSSVMFIGQLLIKKYMWEQCGADGEKFRSGYKT